MDPDNGILGQVPGEFIAAASRLLPEVATHHGADASAEIEAGHVGPVRIRFEPVNMRHGRGSHWAWVAVHAERVGMR